MKSIPLSGAKAAGRAALVDDEDYELASQHKWHVAEIPAQRGRRARGPYAITNIKRNGRWTSISMHSLITGYRQVDHHNHNTLDNQRSNLRDGDHNRNAQNAQKQLRSRSQYKGVFVYKWGARIQGGGQSRHLGYFDFEEDAARAYDDAARAEFGEYAYLNFPG